MGRAMPKEAFDAFWRLKHDIYTLLIGSAHGAALDAIAQAFMRANRREFSAVDFLLTEPTFKNRYRSIFRCLTLASKSMVSLKNEVPASWLSQEIQIKSRSFFVRGDIDLINHADLDNRYQQKKCIQGTTLHQLIAQT